MSSRRRRAKGTVLRVVASKSKSKPSITERPNGRFTTLLAEEDGGGGPNMAHSVSAQEIASAEEEKPPSVYVAPPRESRIVFPWDLHLSMSAAISGQSSSCVPGKTAQESLAEAKLTSVGDLMLLRNAMGMMVAGESVFFFLYVSFHHFLFQKKKKKGGLTGAVIRKTLLRIRSAR